MKEIKRFHEGGYGNSEMKLRHHGDWVLYGDHEEIVAALQEQVRALAAENEFMRPAVFPTMRRPTPATDAVIREIRAQAVEGFAQDCDDSSGLVEPEDEELYVLMAESARTHAARIRSGEQP